MVTRKVAGDWDRTHPVPLAHVVNFGPATLAELEALGITTLDQLEGMGFEAAARCWVEVFPERLNVNAFLGLVATLDGIAWTEATETQRDRARRLVNQMRRELGLPPRQHTQRKANAKPSRPF